VFRENGGVMRAAQALQAGVSSHALYTMLDRGVLERLSRGVYRLTDMPPLGNPDLVTAAMKIPHAVVCLISALSFHGITTQIPHEVMMAVARNMPRRQPKITYPPIHLFPFSEKAFRAGVETHEMDGVPVKIYSAEKTIADCFKYRNKIGFDVALEALRLYCEGGATRADALMEFARICRVQHVIRPYLESLL
jgi:predicted transcriptional regulator of viral defense system